MKQLQKQPKLVTPAHRRQSNGIEPAPPTFPDCASARSAHCANVSPMAPEAAPEAAVTASGWALTAADLQSSETASESTCHELEPPVRVGLSGGE